MKFEKGHKKKGGRKKGTPNKINRKHQELMERILGELDKTIIEDIELMRAKDRIKLWVDLQAYVLPKLKPVGEEKEQEDFKPITIRFVDAEGKEKTLG
ncbi:MAG: hypothetical protein ACW98F_20710, partial [Candidatus Hodarchaeales archaeon]